MKSEIVLLEEKDNEKEEYIAKIEREKRIITEANSNFGNNMASENQIKGLFMNLILRNDLSLKESNSKLLRDIFGKNFDYMKFLQLRIDTLELQNYFLITKNEKNINLMKTYLDELIEVYEVVSDIRNVLNQVYEMQSLTKEFVLIRETLNTKNEFLMKKKEIFIEEKKNNEFKYIKEMNEDILVCKDKIFESKEASGIDLCNNNLTQTKNRRLKIFLMKK